MPKIKSCCQYWWGIATGSKDTFDRFMLALTAIAWLIVGVIKSMGGSLPRNWPVSTEPYFKRAVWVVAVVLTLRAVFWLPFRRHEELKAKLEESKNAKEAKVVEKLTGFGQIILGRISSINGIDPNKYDPNKDDETWNAIADAAAYIVLNLTPEAAQAFDVGIRDIHGFAIPHPGLGSTIYEDRHREVLAKLDRRFRNLKEIMGEIRKYLKPTPTGIQDEKQN